MRPLSAADAIGPAWNHTRNLLLGSRNWRLLFKVAAVAFFANLGGFNSGLNSGRHPHGTPSITLGPWIALAIFAGIFIFAIALALFYIGSRLQFVIFEVVLRRDTHIAPLWRRYGTATWYWIGLKLLFYIAAILCLGIFFVPFIIHFIHAVSIRQSSMTGAQVVSLLFSIFGFVAGLFFAILLIACGYFLLRDFGIPSMAMESTPMRETVARILRLIQAEPGQVALYLILRLLLGFAGIIVAEIAVGIIAVIGLIPLGGIGLSLWFGLHQSSTAGHALMFGGWAILGLILFALILFFAIMTFGYVYTFLQAYALYFLGGRYAPVGQYLDPLLPQPAYYYPPPVIPPTPEPSA
jgi:hypothetical protein